MVGVVRVRVGPHCSGVRPTGCSHKFHHIAEQNVNGSLRIAFPCFFLLSRQHSSCPFMKKTCWQNIISGICCSQHWRQRFFPYSIRIEWPEGDQRAGVKPRGKTSGKNGCVLLHNGFHYIYLDEHNLNFLVIFPSLRRDESEEMIVIWEITSNIRKSYLRCTLH